MSEQEIRAQWLGKRVRTHYGVVGVVCEVKFWKGEIDVLHVRENPGDKKTFVACDEDCELLDTAAPEPSEPERVAVPVPYAGVVVNVRSGRGLAPCVVRHVSRPDDPYSRLTLIRFGYQHESLMAEYGQGEGEWSWPSVPPPVYLKKEEVR